jgi:hypothetical protein
MANTWPKFPLKPIVPSNSYLSLLERDYLEGASQTFPAGAPLKLSSGLLIEWVNPTDADIFAISVTAGQNTTGATVKTIVAKPELELCANFLGSAAADNVLAAADMGLTRDLAKSTTLVDNATNPGWYFADTSSDVAIQISQFRADLVLPNVTQTNPATGDTNARVFASIIAGKSWWT